MADDVHAADTLLCPPSKRLRGSPISRFVWRSVLLNLALSFGMVCYPPLALMVLCGEFTVLSLWAVFGPPPWNARLLGLLLYETILTITASALYLVILLFLSGARSWLFVTPLLALPLAITISQIPLWLVRFFLGWQLVSPDDQDESIVRAQISLRDLFAATTFAAVVLGLAQSAFEISGPERYSAMLIVGVVSFVLLLSNTLFALPSLWAVMISPHGRQTTGVLAIPVSVLLLLLVAPLFCVERGFASSPVGMSIEIACFVAMGSIAWCFPIRFVKRLKSQGYRLLRPRAGSFAAIANESDRFA